MRLFLSFIAVFYLTNCGKNKPVLQIFSIKNDLTDPIQIEIFATQSSMAGYELPASKESSVKHGWKCDTYCGITNYGNLSINIYNRFDSDSRCIFRASWESKCDCHDGNYQITCGPSGCQGSGTMNGATPTFSSCRKN